MKELSIEEKAKAYDEALERAEKALEVLGTDKCEGARQILSLFPELCESENEKIRRALMKFIEKIPYERLENDGVSVKDALAWLEKQGEQKPTNVEPKFKVGDYLVNDYCKGKVIALTDDAYLLDTEQGIPFSHEYNVHLWTIADAEEGDVLTYVTDEEDLWIMIYWSLYEPYEGHVHYHALLVNDNFSDKGTCCICINDLKPATKEQHDLLFQKMHEAGYEWDAEKKELKKIHVIDEGKAEIDYCFTKMMNGEKVSSAWNEEDEKMVNSIEQCIYDNVVNIGTVNKVRYIDWLKSLKQRIKGD